jgi:hypothetical protein
LKRQGLKATSQESYAESVTPNESRPLNDKMQKSRHKMVTEKTYERSNKSNRSNDTRKMSDNSRTKDNISEESFSKQVLQVRLKY